MNDFTKDELETILGHLPINTPERENDEKYQNIYKKLKSMIKSHCEHEWRVGRHLFNDAYCLKCNKHIRCIHE